MHVPHRSCVVCASRSPKRDLVRLVRLADGSVMVDETGKRSGRGAYLCQNAACWHAAVQDGRLAKALRTGLTHADAFILKSYASARLAEAAQNR